VVIPKLPLSSADIDFVEERTKLIQGIMGIFMVPSEVIEKPFSKDGEIEWRSVVAKREIQRVEGHDGLAEFDLEESSVGWGHKLRSDHQRRVKGFRISPEAFVDALTTQRIGDLSWTKIVRGLPPDAETLGATYELASRCWIVYVEHPDFPEVESGVRAPLCEVVLHQMDFEGLIQRLKEINRLAEAIDENDPVAKIRPHLQAIMKQYFPEETL